MSGAGSRRAILLLSSFIAVGFSQGILIENNILNLSPGQLNPTTMKMGKTKIYQNKLS